MGLLADFRSSLGEAFSAYKKKWLKIIAATIVTGIVMTILLLVIYTVLALVIPMPSKETLMPKPPSTVPVYKKGITISQLPIFLGFVVLFLIIGSIPIAFSIGMIRTLYLALKGEDFGATTPLKYTISKYSDCIKATFIPILMGVILSVLSLTAQALLTEGIVRVAAVLYLMIIIVSLILGAFSTYFLIHFATKEEDIRSSALASWNFIKNKPGYSIGAIILIGIITFVLYFIVSLISTFTAGAMTLGGIAAGGLMGGIIAGIIGIIIVIILSAFVVLVWGPVSQMTLIGIYEKGVSA